MHLFALRHSVCLAVLAAFGSASVFAHEPAAAAGAKAETAAMSAQAKQAIAVVEAFSAALKAGDIERAAGYLAPQLLVLESGGAEHSRAEYLAEHAGADAEFLNGAKLLPKNQTAYASGDLAWVGTESTIEFERNGAPQQLLSTETMVLKRGPDGWKIMHIHWSSRPAPKG